MAPTAARDYPLEYLAASAMAATINYPLWRASAIGQSGFVVSTSTTSLVPAAYVHAFGPPYKGVVATVLGMTWARAAIFGGSDAGKEWLRQQAGWWSSEHSLWAATVLPPLFVSTIVQIINMPLVRSTITIQNPQSTLPTVSAALRHIYQQHGLAGLWHGTSAGILKTVPKYCTAVVVKGWMEDYCYNAPPQTERERLWRSALKSSVAGLAGAALTNPLDVIRNEMFKTNQSLVRTVRHLWNDMGLAFLSRGLGKNMVAVAIPVACTIFFTDSLIHMSKTRRASSSRRNSQRTPSQRCGT